MSVEELQAQGPLIAVEGEAVYILCPKCDARLYWFPHNFFVAPNVMSVSVCSICRTPVFSTATNDTTS
jgi:hypothetical protein